MTCIVGLAHEGKVWIGGDSAGVSGYDLTVRRDTKVFRNGDYVFGFTDSFRMGQLLHHKFDPPVPPGKWLEQFMVTEWVDALRACLIEGGYATKANNQEEGGNFLGGVSGRLFEVYADYQVGEALDGYSAVGCGAAYALGALYATQTLKTPRARVKTALDAAERMSAGVRSPFAIISGGNA